MKFFGALVVALSAAATSAVALTVDNHLSLADGIAIAAAGLGSLATWFMPPPRSGNTATPVDEPQV